MAVSRSDRWSSGSAYEGYVGRWSRQVAPRFLAWLDVPAGRRWLDVGCGTGVLTEAIVDHAEPVSVVAVDPSDPFLAHARERIRDPRVVFQEGSAASTGLSDAAVDAVVSGLVLNFVPDLDAALAEARRVVAPGGIVAAYVWDYVDGMELMRRFWDAAVALDARAAEHDEGSRFSRATPEPLKQAFQAAGLGDVEIAAIEIPTVFPDFTAYWTPFLGGVGPGPVYVASLDERARDGLRERLRSTLPTAADGSISLRARAWTAKGRVPPA